MNEYIMADKFQQSHFDQWMRESFRLSKFPVQFLSHVSMHTEKRVSDIHHRFYQYSLSYYKENNYNTFNYEIDTYK